MLFGSAEKARFVMPKDMKDVELHKYFEQLNKGM